MTELEQYYNEAFKEEGFPNWEDLTEKQIKDLKDSLGYWAWGFRKAQGALANAFGRTLNEIMENFNKNMKGIRRP